MSAIRIMELAYGIAWLFGLFLYWRHTRRAFLLGAYIGCSLCLGFDWLLASPLIWNMQFAPGTFMVAEWFGRAQPLWGPVSYGVFFGLVLFAWLWLRERIGPSRMWKYLIASAAVAAISLAAEMAIIPLTHGYRYALPDKALLLGVPWMHLVTTGLMTLGILALCSKTYELLRSVGWDDFRRTHVHRNAEKPLPRGVLLAIGIALPQAAYYGALIAALYLYSGLGLGPATSIAHP